MIHNVRLPEDTKWYLWQIIQIQMDVLRCASTLAGGFTQGNLQTALETTVQAPRAQNISQWVFSHKDTREGLLLFSNHNNLGEKSTIVAEMQRDVNRLYTGTLTETLERRFPIPTRANPLPGYLDGTQQFLIYFYDFLENGLPDLLFAENQYYYPKFGRDQFFGAFDRENPGQYVCAICDEHRFMTILRGKHFSDIEHYFPKSIYPHLVCHPYNLIPICKPCNTAHLNTDPLLANDPRRLLGEIFLPYRNEGVIKQGLVKLNWQKTPANPKTPILSITSQKEPGDMVYAKLQAFSEIYNIPGRWQGHIHQIGEQLWRYIRQYVRIEIESGKDLDLLQLKSELEQLLEYFFEDLGKSPWAFVLIWYLGNILVEEIETGIHSKKEDSPFLDTVKNLLENRSKNGPTGHRLRAKEIIETARILYNEQAIN